MIALLQDLLNTIFSQPTAWGVAVWFPQTPYSAYNVSTNFQKPTITILNAIPYLR